MLLRWLPLSLALHAAAFAATLLVPREPALLALFVDLTLTPAAPAPTPTRRGGAGEGRAPTSVARAIPRAAPSPTAGGPASTPAMPPVAIAPAAPPPAARAPAPAPLVSPPAPAEPSGSAPPGVAPSAPAPLAPPAPRAATAQAADDAADATAWNGPSDGDVGTGSDAAGGNGDIAGASGASTENAGGASAGAGAGDGKLALAIPGDGGGVYAPYLALLRRRVQEAVTYPAVARRRGVSGTVHLEIALDPSGAIGEVTLVRSSSHRVLDEAALDAVRAIRRLPFPPDVRPRALRVRLPVVFELR